MDQGKAGNGNPVVETIEIRYSPHPRLSFPSLIRHSRGGGNLGRFLRFLHYRLHPHGGQNVAKRDFPNVPINSAPRLLGGMVKQISQIASVKRKSFTPRGMRLFLISKSC